MSKVHRYKYLYGVNHHTKHPPEDQPLSGMYLSRKNIYLNRNQISSELLITREDIMMSVEGAFITDVEVTNCLKKQHNYVSYDTRVNYIDCMLYRSMLLAQHGLMAPDLNCTGNTATFLHFR